MTTLEGNRIRRTLALRMKGKWSASADDGVQVGHGAGFTWDQAVREALREVDEKHVQEKGHAEP